MQKENLEGLLNIVRKSDKTNGMEDFLIMLSNIPKAFIYVYENLTKEEKEDLKENNKEHFKNVFYQQICQLNDEKFNYYFFEFLSNSIEIKEVRQESLNRPKNILLKKFIESVDIPKNIEGIMNIIKSYHGKDNDKRDQIIHKYKEKLKKLNTLTSPKNKSLYILSELLQETYNKENVGSVIALADNIGFDLIKNGKYLGYGLFSGKIMNIGNAFKYKENIVPKASDIDELNKLFERNTEKPRYEIINELTDLGDPLWTLKELMKNKKNSKIVLYFWNIFQEYIADIPKINKMYQNYFGNKNDNIFDIISNIYSNKKIIEDLNWCNAYKEIQDFVDSFEINISQWKFDDLDEKIAKKDNVKTNIKNKI